MEMAKKLTVDEFYAMETEETMTYELIDGVVMMSPRPAHEHQMIASNLNLRLSLSLANTKCRPMPEIDVKYNDKNSFVPDASVLCKDDLELPKIVFEILSPSSKNRDMKIKLIKYEEMGILEYWIIDPKVKIVIVHDFKNGNTEIYGLGEIIRSQNIPEIVIAVDDIFDLWNER